MPRLKERDHVLVGFILHTEWDIWVCNSCALSRIAENAAQIYGHPIVMNNQYSQIINIFNI